MAIKLDCDSRIVFYTIICKNYNAPGTLLCQVKKMTRVIQTCPKGAFDCADCGDVFDL